MKNILAYSHPSVAAFLKKHADAVGMASSGLCLVHCLLMPFITVFWLQSDHCSQGSACCAEEGGFNYDYLFLAFSAVAVWLASGHCQKKWVKTAMWGCFALLAAGLLLEPWVEHAHLATIPAALGLAAAHFFNWRHCRVCNPHTEHKPTH